VAGGQVLASESVYYFCVDVRYIDHIQLALSLCVPSSFKIIKDKRTTNHGRPPQIRPYRLFWRDRFVWYYYYLYITIIYDEIQTVSASPSGLILETESLRDIYPRWRNPWIPF